MGKGGGRVPSKKQMPVVSSDDPPHAAGDAPIPIENNTISADDVVAANEDASTLPITNLKIFIVFYLMYGHVEGLARRMKRGVDGIAGVEGVLFRVPEMLPVEVLEQMKARQKARISHRYLQQSWQRLMECCLDFQLGMDAWLHRRRLSLIQRGSCGRSRSLQGSQLGSLLALVHKGVGKKPLRRTEMR